MYNFKNEYNNYSNVKWEELGLHPWQDCCTCNIY